MGKKYENLTEKEAEALDLLVNNLKNDLKDQLLQVQFFGSKCRGNFDQDSDIDVLLVVKKRTEEILEKIAEFHLDVDLKYDPNISLIIFSEYEYKKNKSLKSPFIDNVISEGVSL